MRQRGGSQWWMSSLKARQAFSWAPNDTSDRAEYRHRKWAPKSRFRNRRNLFTKNCFLFLSMTRWLHIWIMTSLGNKNWFKILLLARVHSFINYELFGIFFALKVRSLIDLICWSFLELLLWIEKRRVAVDVKGAGH